MKAKSLIVVTLLAVLALTPLTPPVHGGMAGGLAMAQGPQPPAPPYPPQGPGAPESLPPWELEGKPFGPLPSPLARIAGEGVEMWASSPMNSLASLPPLQDISAIAAGGDHTCALMASGGVKCWGDNW